MPKASLRDLPDVSRIENAAAGRAAAREFRPGDSAAAYLEDCGVDTRHLYDGAGCDQCRQTGYKGRIGLFELLVLDDEVRDLIVRDVPLSEVSQTVSSESSGAQVK